MASFISSVKAVISDSNPFLKAAIFAGLLFWVTEMVKDSTYTPQARIIACAFVFLLVLGFLIGYVHNLINVKNVSMPSFLNPFRLAWDGINGFFALAPFLAIVYFGVEKVRTLLSFEPMVNNVILVLLFATLFSFFVVGMLLYCKDYKFFASYDLKKILKYSGEFIVHNILLTISVAILSGVVFVPAGYAVNMMFGPGKVLDFFIVYSVVLVMFCVFNYYSQLYFEFIDLDT